MLEVDVGKEEKGKVVMAPGDGQTRSGHNQELDIHSINQSVTNQPTTQPINQLFDKLINQAIEIGHDTQ